MEKHLLSIISGVPGNLGCAANEGWSWPVVAVAAAAVPLAACAWLWRSMPNGADRPFLSPTKWQAISIVDKSPESELHAWMKYRFALPKQQQFGLAPGQHVEVRLSLQNGAALTKKCVPFNVDEDAGYIDFIFKAGEGADEWGGALQDMLGRWSLDVRGPFGNWKYDACSTTGVGLLASGEGVAPLYALARAISENKSDITKVRLIVPFTRLEDVFLNNEMDALAAGYYGKFKVFFLVKELYKPGQGYPHHHTELTKEYIDRLINIKPHPGMRMITCGPGSFNEATRALLEQLGYTADMRLELDPHTLHMHFGPDLPPPPPPSPAASDDGLRQEPGSGSADDQPGQPGSSDGGQEGIDGPSTSSFAGPSRVGGGTQEEMSLDDVFS